MKRDILGSVRSVILVLAVANTALTAVLFCYSSVITWPYDDYLVAIQLFLNFALSIAMVFSFIAKKRTGLRKRSFQVAAACACLGTVSIAPLLRNIKDKSEMCQALYKSVHPCHAQLFLSVSQLVCIALLLVESFLNFNTVKAKERRKAELGPFTIEDLQIEEPQPPTHYNPDLDLAHDAVMEEELPTYQKTSEHHNIVDMAHDPPPHHDFGEPTHQATQPLSQQQ
ncbi:hypothetical protein CPB97_007295 [Podila verticillata]|nr:hypothetical protein CPB97_007295 [Podila verticillata]